MDKIRDIIEFKLIDREGCRRNVYMDTTGNLTGGYGHKILPSDNLNEHDLIPDDLIEKWFQHDCDKAEKEAIIQGDELNRNSVLFIAALACANYQLGDFEHVFYGSFGLLKAGDWQAAITHLEASTWMKQTPVRVNDLIAAIRKEYQSNLITKTINFIKGKIK